MAKRQHIPESIYESLPYSYMGGGVLVVAALPNAWGIISGMLLLLAGVWVWWVRRIYRRTEHPPVVPSARETNALTINREAGLVHFVWSRDYERGHVTIDTQHRKLIELGNTLLNAILDKKPKLDVELLLEELIKDLSIHFSTEDNMLTEANHPLRQEYQEHHGRLLERCRNMAERYHKGELKAGDLFKFVAHDVVSDHVLKEDFKLLAGV